ncbi:hypothetical protein B9Z55_021659 [Caenorhabditis nigoni]|uniref:Uncharacterized protein n=1 Tax=Caenorhabditis nigoni TaxID=1611254 RepID=A0A2G5TT10_9PELO|nr:hypothetical protein B9Z55_021659 [Caenorhabditis nigoni]
MKLLSLVVFLITLLSIFVFPTSSAVLKNMDDNGTVPTQRNVPEHIPGSNMIGAGRGARVQDWKKSQTTKDNIPQAPPNRPQQHDATVPVDKKQ